jgi:hypothetical protein
LATCTLAPHMSTRKSYMSGCSWMTAMCRAVLPWLSLSVLGCRKQGKGVGADRGLLLLSCVWRGRGGGKTVCACVARRVFEH